MRIPSRRLHSAEWTAEAKRLSCRCCCTSHPKRGRAIGHHRAHSMRPNCRSLCSHGTHRVHVAMLRRCLARVTTVHVVVGRCPSERRGGGSSTNTLWNHVCRQCATRHDPCTSDVCSCIHRCVRIAPLWAEWWHTTHCCTRSCRCRRRCRSNRRRGCRK